MVAGSDEFFPSAFTNEGGVPVPNIPSDIEMRDCAYAKRAKVECPRKSEEDVCCCQAVIVISM